MRRTRTFAVTLVTLAALGLTLGACGGGGNSSPQSSRNENLGPPTGPGDYLVPHGPVVIAGATKGGSVTVLTHDGLAGTLDPSDASTPGVVSILSGLVTRSLTQYRYDRKARQMILVPDLATTLGVHNGNYTNWEFTVRSGVRFQDGTEVNAFTVARGMRRCWLGRAFPGSPCHDAPIKSVTVGRRKDVIIRFTRPYPDMPYLAALPAVGPIPEGTPMTPGAYGRRPAATGPYRVQSYRPSDRLVLVRNHEWDARSDPVRTQYPKRYVFRSGLTDAAISRRLRADRGTAQTSLTYDTMRPGAFRHAGAQQRLVLGTTLCTTYLVPNPRTIRDPAVRRALIWAYPYDAVLRAAGLVPGVTAVAASTLVPLGVQGRTPYRTPGHTTFATRPRVAHRMLAQAHALGTRLRFTSSPDDRASVRTKNALVRAFRAAGFDPEPTAPGSGPVDLRTSTRCGRWPLGDQWLAPVYRSTHRALVRRIVRMPLASQGMAWNGLDHTALGSGQPIVPLWYSGVAMAHGSQVQGMVDDSVYGMPVWQRLWVQQ